MKCYRISEIFYSIQGEGHYTGVPSLFLRFWGCNFQCRGFGKELLSENTVKVISDYQVAETGCDTNYSWDPTYLHLSEQLTASEIGNRIMALVPCFLHPRSLQWIHLVLTGGEPMLSQSALVDVFKLLADRENLPKFVTIETNGTQIPHDLFSTIVENYYSRTDREWFWSVSPKLSISGEVWENAICPHVLSRYRELSNVGQLKFVVDGSESCWEEVSYATAKYRAENVDWPVTIMPVGATLARLEEVQKVICQGALERGYLFSPRVHTWLFGNLPGT